MALSGLHHGHGQVQASPVAAVGGAQSPEPVQSDPLQPRRSSLVQESLFKILERFWTMLPCPLVLEMGQLVTPGKSPLLAFPQPPSTEMCARCWSTAVLLPTFRVAVTGSVALMTP